MRKLKYLNIFVLFSNEQMITFCSVYVVHSVPFLKSHPGCVIMRTLNLSCLCLGDRTADFI